MKSFLETPVSNSSHILILKVSFAPFSTMMKLLLLFVIVSSSASKVYRQRRQTQNCFDSNCNTNNYGQPIYDYGGRAFIHGPGFFPTPYDHGKQPIYDYGGRAFIHGPGFFPTPSIGSGTVQTCTGGSNCNQKNGRKKRDVTYFEEVANGCKTFYKSVCTDPVCNGLYCQGRKKRDITVEKGAAKSRVKRACWAEAIKQIC